MKVTKISVEYGRTVQPRDYESIRTNYRVEADLAEDEDVSASLDKLYVSLRTKVITAMHEDLLKEKGK